MYGRSNLSGEWEIDRNTGLEVSWRKNSMNSILHINRRIVEGADEGSQHSSAGSGNCEHFGQL